MAVDIIIPIYNALDDLKLCVNSVFENTDLLENRLILVNDNSSDPNVKEYLNGLICDDKNIIVIHNDVNKGFSGNVNIGMEQSETNDVLLLNSDTVVTRNWIEKITACAYSDKGIGTVTPLSNNATLCSVPEFCKENELPEGMSAERMAEIVERCSLRKYPRITVAHGFCMFIKREVINAIGNFDSATFERGYGEENDFCNRAEQAGYIHVMCDDTYILHTGTKSFVSDDKRKLIEKHNRILYDRYPKQMKANEIHCATNPNGFVGENVGLHLLINNGKKNILYLLQADFKKDSFDNVGGTQAHVKDLTMGLKDKYNVFVLARNKDVMQLTLYSEDKVISFDFAVGDDNPFQTFHSREMSSLFKRILKLCRIDIVHVHHVNGSSLDIFEEAHNLSIPIVFTVHDFYSICPTVNILNCQNEVCYGNESGCAECVEKKIGIYYKDGYIKRWRAEFEKSLGYCAEIVCPSKSAAQIVEKIYPSIKSKLSVISHGSDVIDERKIEIEYKSSTEFGWEIDNTSQKEECLEIECKLNMPDEISSRQKVYILVKLQAGETVTVPTNHEEYDALGLSNKFKVYIPNYLIKDSSELSLTAVVCQNEKVLVGNTIVHACKNVNAGDNFRVAFIGGISEVKGGQIISDIVKERINGISWYLFGGIGYANLLRNKTDDVVATGWYNREDLPALLKLHRIDAIGILSIWPETFSYTVSEAVDVGVPVIVTDIGALGERVRENGYGKTVSIGSQSSKEFIDTINEWKDNKEVYNSIKNTTEKFQGKSVSEMVSEYDALYSKRKIDLDKDKFPISEEEIKWFFEAYLIGTKGRYSDGGSGQAKLKMLQDRLEMIDNSVTWKWVNRIARAKIPGRAIIKKVLK